jgi:ribonuclease P/MRP protein subunit RPP1
MVISSECNDILSCRGPADIVNLAAVWGLGQERGVESVTTEARKCVVNAGIKRTSYRGVVDVIYGGERIEKKKEVAANGKAKGKGKNSQGGQENKRKFAEMNVAADVGDKPLSNRQKKRLAKEAAAKESGVATPTAEQTSEKDPSSKTPKIPQS